jgi:predicted dinucleotide-binding enzyme
MKIAVIGSGARAAGISKLLEGGGYHVTLADTSPEGAVPYDAVTGRDIVVLAAPRGEMDDIVNKVGRLLPETIVVDALEGDPLPDGESGAELLAKRLDSRRVVRASIQVPEPNANILLAADDPEAMTIVEEIFRTCGCVTTDRGTLVNAAEIEPPRTGVVEAPRTGVRA